MRQKHWMNSFDVLWWHIELKNLKNVQFNLGKPHFFKGKINVEIKLAFLEIQSEDMVSMYFLQKFEF